MGKSVATWRPYTDDFAATCRRSNAFDAAIGTPTDPCLPQAATQERLAAVLTILDNYFGALSAVATDSNYSLDPGLDDLGSAAKGAGLNAGKATAITALAKSLAGLFTAGLRQKSLDQLIDQAPNAILAVDAVEYVILNDYGGQLTNEAGSWWTNAIILLSRSDAMSPPRCAGKRVNWVTPADQTTTGQLLFQRYYVDGCNRILDRQATLATFRTAAETVKQSLATLEDNRARLKTDAAIAALTTQAKDLFDKTRAVEKAFKTGATGGAS